MTDHSTRLNALTIFFLAILVTVAFRLALPSSWQANESSDFTTFYDPVARALLTGQGLSTPDGAFAARYPPGFPALLALIYQFSAWLRIPESAVMTGFIILCAGLSSLLVYAIAKHFWAMPLALIPPFLWMIYPFHLWLTKQPNSEIVFIPLLLAAFWLLSTSQAACYPSVRSFFAGLLCAAATLVRPAGIAFSVAMLGCLFILHVGLDPKRRVLHALVFCCAWLILIAPWQITLRSQLGPGVFISTGGLPSMRDGISYSDNATQGDYIPALPPTVQQVTNRLVENMRSTNQTGQALYILFQEIQRQPGAVFVLLIIKAARSWYATESGRLELPSLLLQIPYLTATILAGFRSWRAGGMRRQLVQSVMVITFFGWLTTISVLSILRYMLPVFPFLFLLFPAILPLRWQKPIYTDATIQAVVQSSNAAGN